MTAPTNRRGFLRDLAALPLIGGGVTLIGQPTAVAEPVTPDLLEAYKAWLDTELRSLAWEMADDPRISGPHEGVRYQGATRNERWRLIRSLIAYVDVGEAHEHPLRSSPYDRAALVLSTVGCDWRGP